MEQQAPAVAGDVVKNLTGMEQQALERILERLSGSLVDAGLAQLQAGLPVALGQAARRMVLAAFRVEGATQKAAAQASAQQAGRMLGITGIADQSPRAVAAIGMASISPAQQLFDVMCRRRICNRKKPRRAWPCYTSGATARRGKLLDMEFQQRLERRRSELVTPAAASALLGEAPHSGEFIAQ